jgi:hypothetical protein
MAMSDIEILHTGWDCLWSRPGRHRTGVSEDLQRERTRVCVHNGDRRPVSDDECARCALWEPLPAGVYAAGATRVLGRIAAIEAPTPMTSDALQRLALRALLMLMAIGFGAAGFMCLTNILWIPFTIALWLCAASLGGVAIFWRMDAVD